MHAFMHTLLSLIVVGISIQGLGTGNWTPRRRRRSCWTRPGALGKAASCSRDHASKFDHLFGIFSRCQCEYRHTFIFVSEYVLLHCITFYYSNLCKSTIDLFLDIMVMILYVIFVLRQYFFQWARKIIEQSATTLQYSAQKSMTVKYACCALVQLVSSLFTASTLSTEYLFIKSLKQIASNVHDWSTYSPNVPPQKQEFNTALLRDTNCW